MRSAHLARPVLVMEALPLGQLRLLGLSCHGLRPCTWCGQRPPGQAEWEMLTASCVSSPHSHCPACTDLVSWMLCLLARRGSLVPSRRSSGELRLRWMWAGMLPSKGLAAPLSPPARHAAVTCWRHGTQPSHAASPGTLSFAPASLQSYCKPHVVLLHRLWGGLTLCMLSSLVPVSTPVWGDGGRRRQAPWKRLWLTLLFSTDSQS